MNLRMTGKYLLDQSAAGTWHAKHENRNRRGIALSVEAIQQAAVEPPAMARKLC